jgi:hypothetical protein
MIDITCHIVYRWTVMFKVNKEFEFEHLWCLTVYIYLVVSDCNVKFIPFFNCGRNKWRIGYRESTEFDNFVITFIDICGQIYVASLS